MTRGLWSRETVALLMVAALVPLACFWLWFGGPEALVRLMLAGLVIAIWQLVFMLARAQPPSVSGIVTALAIAMLAPEDLGGFRLVLGISFGVVMGELVFGGWGRNVVNPATISLAFLGFGFPTYAWPVLETPIAWAALPAAVLGMVLGVMPAAAIVAAAIVGAAAATAGLLPDNVLYAGAIVLVLLVADPVTCAATALGRWLHGAIYISLLVLFAAGWVGAAPLQIAVAAALLSSLAAPLLDDLTVALWTYRRWRRHGRT